MYDFAYQKPGSLADAVKALKILKRSMPLTPYRVRSIRPLWPCDCSAAQKKLGWKPRVSIEQGMAATFPEAKEPGPGK